MRRNNLIMLVVLAVLYLGTSWIMGATYGPSYGFMTGEDYWRPDGSGGWVAHGNPADPAPDQPSINVPLLAHYLPILIPGFLLILFLFTPLRVYLDGKPAPKEPEDEPVDGEEAGEESEDKPA